MARTVRGGSLETRASRLRLKPRGKPYWVASAKQGLHLGYRRLAGKNGTWIARRYQGRGGDYDAKAFAQADDHSDADGAEVLAYYDAMRRLSGEAPPVHHGRNYAVSDAIDDYVGWLTRHRKSAADTRTKLNAYVAEYFGDRPVAGLVPTDFDRWLEWALTYKPKGRHSKKPKAASKKKKEQVNEPPKPVIEPAELKRRKKSTLNRVIASLVGMLNRAFEDGHITSRDAWARLQKFRGADSARIARLSADEATKLINACPADFRQLVEAALLTGCRYGELCAIRARDFDYTSATLLVSESKSGKARRVPLNEEGKKFFESITAGKSAENAVLTKEDGMPWKTSEQFRRISAACAAAKIIPAINFHALRHSFASLLVEAGTPLAFVAEVLGHSDSRMVSKYYAHLAPSVVHDSIRAKLPNFGVRIYE
jgi:integrase